jgi:hypothetical protein
MSEDRVTIADNEFEQRLVVLGTNLQYPGTPDIAGAVRIQLEQAPARGRRSARLFRQPVLLYPILAALVLLGSLLALSPAARSAVASWFHLTGVQIEERQLPPGRLGRTLNLGTRTTLAGAQSSVPFHISLPLAAFGEPDEVYVGNRSQMGPSISLVYRARRDLRRASTTGAGLLITEFRARFWDAKMLPTSTSIEPVRVNRDVGLWLSGTPHALFYIDLHGRLLHDTGRLAGNALLWQHGTVTMRLEGRLTLDRALTIAQSMR